MMIIDMCLAHGSYSIKTSFAPLTLGETKGKKKGMGVLEWEGGTIGSDVARCGSYVAPT